MLSLYYDTSYPIWDDIYMSTEGTPFASYDALDFYLETLTVTTDQPVIYEGRAVKRPGDSYIKVKLNDVIVPWLRARLTGMATAAGGCMEAQGDGTEAVHAFRFSWHDPDPDAATSYHRVTFCVFADWTYDRTAAAYAAGTLRNYVRTDPVDRVLDTRQWALFTTLVGASAVIINATGGSTVASLGTAQRPKAPKTWYVRAANLTAGTYKFRLTFPSTSPFSGSTYTGDAFTVKRTCARYAVYYVNALGGYDTFLIRGRSGLTDALQRSEYTRRAPTALLSGKVGQRGRTVIGVEATRALELHTHWLTDDEASRMFNLVESPEVYVHDLESDLVHPAVIVNTSHEEKTYRGGGNRLVSYQIDVELAAPIERR